MSRKDLDIEGIIIQKITEEFQEILNSEPDFYNGFRVVITNERQFVKSEDRKPNVIFIVVKFLEGNKDFGQQRQPYTINAISEHNTIDVCQKLMFDFSETFNLSFDLNNSDYTLRQTVQTPSQSSSFAEVYDGYRSTFYLSGTFFIGINSNPIISIKVSDESGLDEDIDFLSSQMSFDIQTDSQPFFGTNNYNRSVGKTGTLSIGFSMYSVDTDFYNKAMDTAFNYNNSADINNKYTVVVTLKNGRTYSAPMKLVSVSNVQELRNFPVTSFTFVR